MPMRIPMAAATILACVLGIGSSVRAAAETVKVGVFDARAVAIAYYRSELHRKDLEGRVAEVRKADEAGDRVKARLIERGMRDLQAEAHRQVFGVGPYATLGERMKGVLEQVGKRAGLKAIGPEIYVVAAGVERVDVTEEVLSALAVDAKTRQVIDDMRRKINAGDYRPEEFKGE
jgi:hypothetical protein